MEATLIPNHAHERTPLSESSPLVVADQAAIESRRARVEAFCIDDPDALEPFSKALQHEMDWDEEFARLAIAEYKRFMILSSVFPDDNMTPSVHVDTVWHMHLLYTRSYQRFCREALDSLFVHHEPSLGGEEEEETHKNSYAETLDRYFQVFQSEPAESIWGARVRAELQEGDI